MAKKRKVKIPKRVAGIKIPKGVRKGPVGNFLTSHAGQIAFAEALALVTGALAARRDSDKDGEALRHPVDSLKSASARAVDSVGDNTARFARAMREAAHTFMRVLSEDVPVEDAALEAGSTPESVDDLLDTSAKKKRGTSSKAEATQGHH